MRQRTLIGEIAIGVLIAVIAAVIIAHFGIEKADSLPGNSPHPPVEHSSRPVAEVSPRFVADDNQDPRSRDLERSFSLIGSWQGSFLINNNPVNDVYTFSTNGNWAEAAFNQFGQQILEGQGAYSYAGGQVVISFFTGGYEKASVTWIDANQFHYRIIDHTEPEQIGLEIDYKRLSQ